MQDLKLVLVSAGGKSMYVRDASQDYHCQYGMV